MSDSDIQMKLGKIEKDYKKGMEHASRDGGDTVSVQRAKEALDGLADALMSLFTEEMVKARINELENLHIWTGTGEAEKYSNIENRLAVLTYVKEPKENK